MRAELGMSGRNVVRQSSRSPEPPGPAGGTRLFVVSPLIYVALPLVRYAPLSRLARISSWVPPGPGAGAAAVQALARRSSGAAGSLAAPGVLTAGRGAPAVEPVIADQVSSGSPIA